MRLLQCCSVQDAPESTHQLYNTCMQIVAVLTQLEPTTTTTSKRGESSLLMFVIDTPSYLYGGAILHAATSELETLPDFCQMLMLCGFLTELQST